MPFQNRTNGMTDRQREVLAFIVEHHAAFKICPTSREIAERFGFRQTAAVLHINALIKNGAPISKTTSGRLVYHDPSERIPWEDLKPMFDELKERKCLYRVDATVTQFFEKYPHLKE